MTCFFEDKRFENCVFLILDKNFYIVNISKNAEEILGIQHVNYESNFYINDYIEDFDIVLKESLNQRNNLKPLWLLWSRIQRDKKIDVLFEIMEIFNEDATQTNFYIVKLVFK